jgi:hypothetical protein
MKTNAKRKNSAMKKLVPAAGMLALSASMLATSTYAWFTMNKTVYVNGMEMKTKVGSNLLICDTNNEADYKADTLSQSVKALLEPASTVNGTTGSFYYTVDAAANGKKAHAASGENVYKAYSEAMTTDGGESTANNAAPDATASLKTYYDKLFNSTYGITSPAATDFGTAYGYVDYVFYLKGTSDEANQQIVMSECNLIYMGADDATNTALAANDKAWRIAVFADNITEGRTDGTVAADPAGSGKIAKAILTPSGAALFDNTAVDSPTSKNSVTYNTWNENNLYKFTAAGQTVYEKVTVRVWLEGEDTTCKSSTYAELSKRYKLNLKFEIANSTDVITKNVDNIGSVITGDPAVHIKADA